MFARFSQIIKRMYRLVRVPTHNATEMHDTLMTQLSSAWLQPPPDFDEQRYLSENKDVRDFVKQGRFASGFDHYMKHGRNEGRRRPIKHL